MCVHTRVRALFLCAKKTNTIFSQYSTNQGIVDYLCNELYRLSNEAPEDIDFYITQLW